MVEHRLVSYPGPVLQDVGCQFHSAAVVARCRWTREEEHMSPDIRRGERDYFGGREDRVVGDVVPVRPVDGDGDVRGFWVLIVAWMTWLCTDFWAYFGTVQCIFEELPLIR